MIRITRLTDYGIVLLTLLARAKAGTVASAPELARRTGLPLPTVSKILKTLSRASLLTSLRGTQGGYRLARRPEEVSVREIVSALEGPIALTTCSGEPPLACEIEGACPVRGNWRVITEAVEAALDAITLAEMARPLPSPAVTEE